MRRVVTLGLPLVGFLAASPVCAVERSIDGTALADVTASQEDSANRALGAITRALADYPRSILAIDLGEPKVETQSGKTYLAIPLEVKTDLQAYEKVADELDRGLSAALPAPLEFETGRGHEIYFSQSPAKPPMLIIATEIASDLSRIKWKAFAIPEKVEGWLKGHQRPPVPPLQVVLKGADGEPVWSSTRRVGDSSSARGFICRSRGGDGVFGGKSSDRFYLIAPYIECSMSVGSGLDPMAMAVMQGMLNQLRDGRTTQGEQGDQEDIKKRVAAAGEASFVMEGEVFGFKGVLKAEVPPEDMARVKTLSGDFAAPDARLDLDE